MKKYLMKMIALALALVLLAGLTAAQASSFTFGSSESAAEEENEPAAETPAREEEAPAEAETGEEAGAEKEEEQEAEPEEESAAEVSAEGMPTGFAETLETLAPKLEEIFAGASKWSKKKAPAALKDFPVLPADYQGIYEWMNGKTASFSERDGAYAVETEEPSFLPLSGEAVAYFMDMSTLKLTRTGDGLYSADKAGDTARQAADFWRIDLSARPWALKTDAGILWDFSAGVSIASAGMRGPAGGTDEIYFAVHRTGEINQSIVWYIRRGELTVDIYYGNGNEVCRELTYDIKTGKLVSSEEW